MVATLTSPNPDNYYIGKGPVSVAVPGVSPLEWRRLGNVPEFEFTPELETLPHYDSQQGVRTKDKEVIISKSAKLRVVMEEHTLYNLGLQLFGEVVSGQTILQIFSLTEILLAVRFVGANTVGPRITLIFPTVSFKPSKSFNPISAEWNQMEMEGDVLSDIDGNFGTCEWFAN